MAMFAQLYRNEAMRQHQRLTVSTTKSRVALRHAVRADGGANTRTRAGGNGWVGAKHANSGPKFGSTKRNHVFADVASDNLPMLRV